MHPQFVFQSSSSDGAAGPLAVLAVFPQSSTAGSRGPAPSLLRHPGNMQEETMDV